MASRSSASNGQRQPDQGRSALKQASPCFLPKRRRSASSKRSEVLAKAVAGSAAQAARERAVEAQARLLRSGLDRLDFDGWRRFLSPLVDHIRVRPEALEVGFIFAPPAPAIEETQANSRARIGSPIRTE